MPFDHPDDPARQIYRYHNGERDIAADPAVIWRGINLACQERAITWDALCEQWMGLSPREGDSPGEASSKAIGWLALQETITAVARAAFRLSALDESGNGVTEAQVMAILGDFIAYREKKDESTGDLPSGSGPTDGGLTDISSQYTADSPMNITTDSRSTSSTSTPSTQPPRSARSARRSAPNRTP